MMKKMFFPASAIITTYGSLLLVIGFFFLMRDNSLHQLQSALPLHFIYRFCTFWFISVVFAIVFFLLNLNMNHLREGADDNTQARRRFGLLALGIAAFSTALAVAVVLIFHF